MSSVGKDVIRSHRTCREGSEPEGDEVSPESSSSDSVKKDQFSSEHHPQFKSHRLVMRRKVVVPVLLGPNLTHRGEVESEEWARDMMVLFKPWRTAIDLKDKDTTWMAAFTAFEPFLTQSNRIVIQNILNLTRSREDRCRHPRLRR
ncbi:hypothetical protein BKA70DRAFT_1110008, partial [Coprinopsis sp. MPI-PUGE-AT-0042]